MKAATLRAISIQEILEELPKLTPAERQALIQRTQALEQGALTPEDHAILDARMADFQQRPDGGMSLEMLKGADAAEMLKQQPSP